MLLFSLEFTLPEIASYMAAHVLPDIYENMRLEKIGLDPERLNGSGTQPLILTYSVTGRVEDFEMEPETHAFPLISSVHPFFQSQNATFVPYTPQWSWDEEKMCIFIQPNRLTTDPTGEVISTRDAYVSISRQQIFVSFEILQEYLAAQFAFLGLELRNEQPIQWDPMSSRVLYHTEKVTLEWFLARSQDLNDLFHFLSLDVPLERFRNFISPQKDERSSLQIRTMEEGLIFNYSRKTPL